jgi:hypothetical protein
MNYFARGAAYACGDDPHYAYQHIGRLGAHVLIYLLICEQG